MDISTEFSDSCSDATDSKKSFKCSLSWCKAAFSKQWKLVVHTRKHTGERPFVCDLDGCKKTYTNSAHLRRHKCLVHEKSEQVKCEEENCGKVLNNKYALKKHINHVHKTSKSYSCKECGETFERKKLLNQHNLKHTKAFLCKECNKEFSCSREFTNHKRVHKIYTCDCGQTFNKWTLICAHRREVCIPVNKCIICDQTFKQPSNLKTHYKSHLEESNKEKFVCEYENCNRSYDYKKNLLYHIRRYHLKEKEELPCTYPDCRMVLCSKRNLKLHIEKVHHKKIKANLPRKPRFDKGTKRKAMASKLSGLEISNKEHFTIINSEKNKAAPKLNLIKTDRRKRKKIETITSEKNNKDNDVNIESCNYGEKNHEDFLLEECDNVLKKIKSKINEIN
ncbi:unnamed protein product [Brassicogethes aeneus]|uniref:C2H2-type domain-containing protein n=1 Tax=Brassicogethes aeneus TaxID=1431903 RepID=A0A9P0FN41_BRAAE|nr:unnamed protein product [Brassicogethes aeneus]